MTTAEPEAIRMSGDEGILAAVPAMLGFHPTDSLVVLSLIEQPGSMALRVGPIARFEAENYRADALDVIATAVGFFTRNHIHHVALICYGLILDPEELEWALAAADIDVVRVLHVDNDPQPIDGRLAAELVGIGRMTEVNREAIRARVEHFKGAPPDVETIERVRSTADRDRLLAEMMRDATGSLPVILAACRSVQDDCLGDETPPEGSRKVVADLCAIAAIVAYRTGDGALSNVALDRALRLVPGHRLATLVTAAVNGGMAPTDLDGLCTI